MNTNTYFIVEIVVSEFCCLGIDECKVPAREDDVTVCPEGLHLPSRENLKLQSVSSSTNRGKILM